MSTMWMRMPGQTWTGAAASFLGMWVVMTAAMMLPSLAPSLWRYRRETGTSAACAAAPMTLVAVGYFAVWALLGAATFPLGVGVASLAMRQPASGQLVSVTIGVVMLIAGALQRSAWKARQLACCREPAVGSGATLAAAWRHGVRLGFHCGASCAGPMAVLLVVGLMDLRAMCVATAAITVERLAPSGERVARATGALAVCGGLLLIARAVSLG